MSKNQSARWGLFLAVAFPLIVWGASCNRPAGPGAGPPGAPGDAGKAGRPWKIGVLELQNAPGNDESYEGFREGLTAAGLVDGADYEVTVRNAQGEMAVLNNLVDAAVYDGVDLLVAISTPCLQVALQRGKNTPIVFTFVANPVMAGAGSADGRHLPNVTGVSTLSDFPGMVRILSAYFPDVKTIGTLYCLSEINSVFYKDELEKEAHRNGIRLLAVSVSSSGEVADAAAALCQKEIQAVCQISDNVTAAAFAVILKTAGRARLPVFVFQTSQVRDGAIVGLSRDFKDAGRDAGVLAARVVRGESVARIPFKPCLTTKLTVNPAAARALGFPLPEALLREAAGLPAPP